MIETVLKNMGGNTPEQIKGAHLARVSQVRVGHPTDRVLKQMVDNLRVLALPWPADPLLYALECYLPYFFGLFQSLLDPPFGHRG